ncbi:MAG: hypothetical protein FWG40_05675 [Peptococcaceae bacterium]|nr:hypothetical protein [Peptococcaceae bacterium]
MGMYIYIGKEASWHSDNCLPYLETSAGIFECIVEETRGLFKDSEQKYVEEIYQPLDEWGQNYISLEDVDKEGFSLFGDYCKKAMEDFPNSETGKSVPSEGMPVILVNWSELLRIMREDPRYRKRQESE